MKMNNIIEEYISKFWSNNYLIARNEMRYFYKTINKYENRIAFIKFEEIDDKIIKYIFPKIKKN